MQTNQKQEVTRILGRTLARELTQEEALLISGGADRGKDKNPQQPKGPSETQTVIITSSGRDVPPDTQIDQ